jgi:hypothetical protein
MNAIVILFMPHIPLDVLVSIREHLECLELVVIPLAAVRSGGSR